MVLKKRKSMALALILAVTLALGGCGNGADTSSTKNPAGGDSSESTASQSSQQEKSAASNGETVKLSVAVYERGNTTNTYGSATDNYWTRWMQSEFGDPNGIELEYIPIPRSEDTAKINTLMASNTAPDIIFSYDSKLIFQFGKNGGLTVLNDYIKNYGPNIIANVGEALPYGESNGEQFAIPAIRAKTGRYTNFLRKDWLDTLGYTIEKNADGFYHMSVEDFDKLLHEVKSKDPDNTGMEIFPLAVAGAHDATQAKPVIFSFVNHAELTDEMAATSEQMTWPGFKEGVRFLNKLYNAKMIDPDFMVDTDTSLPSFNTLVSTGRTFAFGQDDMYKNGIIALYESNPNAEIIPFQLDNVNGEQVMPIYAPTGMYNAVPATCENPEAAVKYLNFLADLETCKVLSYGIEGVHYKMEDGTPVAIEYTDEEKAKIEGYERITSGDMNLLFNGQPFGYKTSVINVTEAEEKYNPMYDIATQLSKVGGIPDYNFGGNITAAEEKYTGFLEKPEKKLPQLIACSVDEFDAMYDSVIDEYMKNGGQEILDEKIELYRKLEAAE